MVKEVTFKAAITSANHKLKRLKRIDKLIKLVLCQDEDAESQCMIWIGPVDKFGEPHDRNDSHRVHIREYLWMLSRPEILWPRHFDDHYENVFFGFLERFFSKRGGVKALETETAHSFPEGFEAKQLYDRGDMIVPCCGNSNCVNPEHLTLIFPRERRDYDFGLEKEFFRQSLIPEDILDKVSEVEKSCQQDESLTANDLTLHMGISKPTAYRYLSEYIRIKNSTREVKERGLLEYDIFELKSDQGLTYLSEFNSTKFAQSKSEYDNYEEIKDWVNKMCEMDLYLIGTQAVKTHKAESGVLPDSNKLKLQGAKTANRLTLKVKEFINRLYQVEKPLAMLISRSEIILEQQEKIQQLSDRLDKLESDKSGSIIINDHLDKLESVESVSILIKNKETKGISNRPGGNIEGDDDYIDVQSGDTKEKYEEWLKTTWPRNYFDMVDNKDPEEYWRSFPPAAFPDYGQIHEFVYDPISIEDLKDQELFFTMSWFDSQGAYDEDTLAMKRAQDLKPEYHADVISMAISSDVGGEDILNEIHELKDSRCMRVVAYYSTTKIVITTWVNSDENGGVEGIREIMYVGKEYNIFE